MKLSVIAIALGLFSSAPCIPEAGIDCHGKDQDSTTALLREMNRNFELVLQAQGAAYEVSAEDIVVFEENEEIDLGFDTAAYLPEGFDAYAGMTDEIEAIGLIEIEEEEIDLGFDTSLYLPEGFDPYEGMDELEGIPTAALEAELKRYQAYSDSYFSCVSISDDMEFVLRGLNAPVMEEEIDLGFDTRAYLPAGFDPYEGMTASVE